MRVFWALAAASSLILSVSAFGQEVGTPTVAEEQVVGDFPILRPGGFELSREEIEAIFDQSEILMPADLFETPKKLDITISNFQRLCDNGLQSFCGEAASLRASQERLLAGANRNLGCAEAANAMLEAYALGNPSDQVARDYDLNCLGAFAIRTGEGILSERPVTLQGAEATGGLLSAVGVLYYDDKPVCAGLLREGRRFVTARHCRGSTDDARFSVQQSTNSFHWNLRFIDQGDAQGTPSDWVVYEVLAGDDYRVAPTALAQLPSNSPLTFVAAYPQAEPNIGDLGGIVPKLRFPRPGLCEAVRQSTGCIQIICQTVKTFSGAPVFRAEPNMGVHEVVGFISGSEAENSNCKTLPLDRSTLAVSATQVPEGL